MTNPAAFRLVPPVVVRSAIARAVVHPRRADARNGSASASLGDVCLMPHQRDAVERIRGILKAMHVALLADDVGLGKTYVALAIAREYRTVRVLAPAALIPMWRNAVARTTSHHVRVESLQRYSRMHECAPFAPNTLVIIDEAHHLRTPTTKRYTAVSQGVTGCDVLLLSATPVHNSLNDLRALLALSLGSDAARLSRSLLASVIVRRTDGATRPPVITHPPVEIPHDPSLLSGILSIPAPLPAHDGAVAGALIRLGLLRAWCSSDAALSATLRRRLLRGEALRHALEAGRHPTTAELRTWLVGEHEVQLAFPELSASHAPETAPLLEILNRHLDAVHALLRAHHASARADGARATALREILAKHPNQPVVAFSQFAETVRAISRALADIAGVGALTGNRAWIASGHISRAEALAQFAPVAQGKPPPAAHQRIILLLTTDLLAEGVNLQDAGVVVHLDLPWTDALRRQRVGRCARVGSLHAQVSVYQFEPHNDAALVLKIEKRLRRKARTAARLIGSPIALEGRRIAGSARRARPSAADAVTRLERLLRTWEVEADASYVSTPASLSASTMLAYVPATRTGFIALLRAIHTAADSTSRSTNGPPQQSTILVGSIVEGPDHRFRVRSSRAPERVYRALRRLPADAGLPATDLTRAETEATRAARRAATRAVRRWVARRAFAEQLGEPRVSSSAVHRRARAMLDQTLSRITTAQRIASRESFHGAYCMVDRARGAGAERALVSWLASKDTQSALTWLSSWRQSTVLCAANNARESGTVAPIHWHLDAMVILRPLV